MPTKAKTLKHVDPHYCPAILLEHEHQPCSCEPDDWKGARGHINRTMNGAWPLGENEPYYICGQCQGFVGKDYADPDKPAMDHRPLYTTPKAWEDAMKKGVHYR